MAKILITGVSGLLGVNMAVIASGAGHEVTGVCHTHPLRPGGFSVVQADLSLDGQAARVIDQAMPDWVVHCAAWTDIDACEGDVTKARRLNRDMAGYVAKAAANSGSRLVHISTDAVFGGKKGHYREGDEARPVNAYALTKLEGEAAVASAHGSAAIVRTNIYGWNAARKSSLAEFFLSHLESGQPCNGFTDVRVTPLLVNDLARILLLVLSEGLRGIYHVGGGECVSKYEFGLRVAELFEMDPRLILPCSVEAAGLRAPRAKEICLCSDNLRAALGIALPGVGDGLKALRRLRDQGYDARLRELWID